MLQGVPVVLGSPAPVHSADAMSRHRWRLAPFPLRFDLAWHLDAWCIGQCMGLNLRFFARPTPSGVLTLPMIAWPPSATWTYGHLLPADTHPTRNRSARVAVSSLFAASHSIVSCGVMYWSPSSSRLTFSSAMVRSSAATCSGEFGTVRKIANGSAQATSCRVRHGASTSSLVPGTTNWREPHSHGGALALLPELVADWVRRTPKQLGGVSDFSILF